MKLRVSSINFSLQKQGKRSRKKYLSKEVIRKIVFKQTMGRFIGVPERMKIIRIAKRHLMQLRLRLDNPK